MLKLDKRLAAIAEEINCRVLADIGTDHGKIVVYCLQSGRAERAYAVDISQKSLQKARILAQSRGVDASIAFVVGDGLTDVGDDADCVVIAGMGGYEIIRILSGRRLDTRYVLVPHQDAAALRFYLSENGYFAEKDYVISEGKRFYDIIVCKNGQGNYKKSELYIGKNTPPVSAFMERLEARRAIIQGITARAKDVSKELKQELEDINNALQD